MATSQSELDKAIRLILSTPEAKGSNFAESRYDEQNDQARSIINRLPPTSTATAPTAVTVAVTVAYTVAYSPASTSTLP
ncbi:predicted protein [Pyrenophora tritici-repentis Pt-1C-BFP]|uniref:Uncharacterized protein n=1 Tax=Pyrenophora tritici-repentis (strain Pt-1C-BFP) TaxID=426418 RepID=B2WP75_PYRTR|nr:uncharacterized protein PTRG_11785 [Pyrenophora tritici-repentis Pt-1C-BFP]EDU45941.1 predicted protein [Pyrenophora tritici-repentis Pt-1C-BFP]